MPIKTVADMEAGHKAARDSWDAVLAHKPEGAHAAIIAIERQDNSDSQSDYRGHKTLRRVVIGWRMTKRESFKALHEAAARFAPTAALASGHEHRENYSMGRGNYLAEHPHDGWEVRSLDLRWNNYSDLVENGLNGEPVAPVAKPAPEIVFNCRVGRSYASRMSFVGQGTGLVQ